MDLMRARKPEAVCFSRSKRPRHKGFLVIEASKSTLADALWAFKLAWDVPRFWDPFSEAAPISALLSDSLPELLRVFLGHEPNASEAFRETDAERLLSLQIAYILLNPFPTGLVRNIQNKDRRTHGQSEHTCSNAACAV